MRRHAFDTMCVLLDRALGVGPRAATGENLFGSDRLWASFS